MAAERKIDPYKPRSVAAKLDMGLPEDEVLRICTHIYLNRGEGKDTLSMINKHGFAYLQRNAMAYASLVKLAMEAMRDPKMGLEATVMPYVREAFPPETLSDDEIAAMME